MRAVHIYTYLHLYDYIYIYFVAQSAVFSPHNLEYIESGWIVWLDLSQWMMLLLLLQFM